MTSEVVPASVFITPNGLLFDQPLSEPWLKRPDVASEDVEYAVGIDWRKTVDPKNAKRIKGAFVNQNIVCKLRYEATVEFFLSEFDAQKEV